MEKEKLVRLVTGAQSGDEAALNALFNAFYSDVYYFALKITKDDLTACDVTQETFIEIINTLSHLKEPAAFVTWMKQIAYHQCTRYFKKKTDILVDEDEEGHSVFDTLVEERTEFIPDKALDQAEFRQTIMDMVDQLPQEQRACVMLFYYDELPIKDIAKIQAVNENTVKSRLNYARKAIGRCVESYEKRTGVRLHCVGVLPVLVWLFKAYFSQSVPVVSAGVMADGVATATGAAISLCAGSTAAASVTAPISSAAAATVPAATATGIGMKIAAAPLSSKLIAGALAATLLVGVPTGVMLIRDSAPDTILVTETPKVTRFVNFDTDGRWQADAVSVIPVEAYCQDGRFVMNCYIMNGYDTALSGVDISSIQVKNGDGRTVASGVFPSQSLDIAPQSYAQHSFIFSEDALLDANADLSTLVLTWSYSYDGGVMETGTTIIQNRFLNESVDGRWTPDAITVIPAQAYYEKGQLVVRCYIFNGYGTARDVSILSLILTDATGKVIANGAFDPQGLTIAPKSYAQHSFTFAGQALKAASADLSQVELEAQIQENS